MIKLQDFARQSGVSERQVHRLVKKYESELEGLMERKGHNGTWLSDEACEVLRSHMKQQPLVSLADSDLLKQIEQLKQEKFDIQQKFTDYVTENAPLLKQAAQQILLLEQSNAKIDDLSAELEKQGQDLARAEKERQEASDELTAFKSMNPREFRKFYKQQRKEERLLKKQEKKQAKSDKTDKE